MGNVVVIGSCNTDMVFRTPKMPDKGETILGGEFDMISGGKGANQAVAASRAGAAVTFITKVGNDDFGRNAIKGYKNDKINTDCILIDKEYPSGIAMILVEESTGNNSIVVAPGANGQLSVDDVIVMEEIIKQANILLVQLEIPLQTVNASLKLAKKYNVITILDPAPAQYLGNEILANVDIITPNETETKNLTGFEPIDNEAIIKAGKFLLEKVKYAVIITLGDKGVYFKSKMKEGFIKANSVKSIDSTAAGDVFNGYLSASLANGDTLETAISKANNAAAISVTIKGAQPSIPFRVQLEN